MTIYAIVVAVEANSEDEAHATVSGDAECALGGEVVFVGDPWPVSYFETVDTVSLIEQRTRISYSGTPGECGASTG